MDEAVFRYRILPARDTGHGKQELTWKGEKQSEHHL